MNNVCGKLTYKVTMVSGFIVACTKFDTVTGCAIITSTDALFMSVNSTKD